MRERDGCGEGREAEKERRGAVAERRVSCSSQARCREAPGASASQARRWARVNEGQPATTGTMDTKHRDRKLRLDSGWGPAPANQGRASDAARAGRCEQSQSPEIDHPPLHRFNKINPQRFPIRHRLPLPFLAAVAVATVSWSLQSCPPLYHSDTLPPPPWNVRNSAMVWIPK